MDILLKYFKDLDPRQIKQFSMLAPLYTAWNSQINVISRKDITNLYEHHVLHSLCVARVIEFKPGTKILDVGTGGGFPGIPLAIYFPETHFHLVDSVGKKIKVVAAIAEELGLKNVTTQQSRAENLSSRFDFVVSRAVTTLPQFESWVRKLVSKCNEHPLPNGILYLKGGNIADELANVKGASSIYHLSTYFEEDYFQTKVLIHIHSLLL